MLKASKKIKAFKNGRRIRMLVFFIALSSLFWILIKLSREYTDIVQVDLNYINLPKDRMLQGEVPEKIDVFVKDYGFNLIKYQLFKKSITVDLTSVKKKKGDLYFIDTDALAKQIKKQLSSEIEISDIEPDTLFFHFAVSRSKQVPVMPDLDLSYQMGYQLLGGLEIDPKAVTVSGPEETIDTIYQVYTEKKQLSDLNSNIDISIMLKKMPVSSNITYSVDHVKIFGRVEKFTEEKFEIPFEIRNIPDNHILQTFPDKVEVVFKVGITDYNKIDKNDFLVVCDYKKTADNGLNYLIPEVIKKPGIVSEVRVLRETIDFFIKK
ncbi:MAG: YbbR-like domain-containing protein [Flavobacteriaceae bacterium]|nr:YbbR-like domain-containing protein [Flavobacteriaceae bacterium]